MDTNSQGKDLKLSKELAEDLVKHFNVINHDKKPVWVANGEKGVLTKNNKVPRRVIVELGRMTNPLDIIKLYEDGTQDKIAKQLKDGIVYNIKKRHEDN